MMDIKTYLYNTLTKSVDEFVPNEEGKVAMYTCGPTVYHFAHIGNLRSYIMEDVLEKYLRYVGYDVKRVMNITDVGHLTSDGDTGEDKMLKGAKREHKTVMDIARFYTDAFMADCEKLSIKRPDVVEPATNCIPEFIHMIEVLLEKDMLILQERMCTLIPQNWIIIMFYLLRMKRICRLVSARMLKKIQIREIRQTLFFGLPNRSLIIRN